MIPGAQAQSVRLHPSGQRRYMPMRSAADRMALELNVEEQQLLADTFVRARSGMRPRERIAELIGVFTFVVAEVVLWSISPPHGFDVPSAVICTLVLALAALVRFETPFGFTVPTQLAFVPLVFSMPMALVPVATLIALALARLWDVFRDGLP